MARIFSIINNKGGTGKTTTTLNLGAALSRIGYKVLLVDFDSQCNLSTALGINNAGPHIGSLLLDKCKIDDVLISFESLSLIPGSEKLLEVEYLINNEPGREYLLKEALSQGKNTFDYIFIDCPPSLGILSINSLVAANYFIVPMQTENFAFIGLDIIMHIADKVKKRMNSKLDLAGILLIKFAYRTKFSKAVISNITSSERMKEKLFENHIRQDIALMESPVFGKTVFDYSPKCRGAIDYINLANEIITKYE